MGIKDPKLYLYQISSSINRIKDYTEDYTKESFGNDQKTIDAVLMQIIVIGENCSRLDTIGYCKTQPSIPWTKIRGMRNLIAHDYGRVDPDEVWNALNIIKTEFAEQISGLLS